MQDDHLLADVCALRDRVEGTRLADAAVHPAHAASARNLGHFLALRTEDLRELQDRLAAVGASSLGRCEAHVLATLDAVVGLLRALHHLPPEPAGPPGRALDYRAGGRRLAVNADALLGPAPGGRDTRIMVTLPSAAAGDPGLVDELAGAGMDVARINCAHDGPDAWAAMAAACRQAGDRRDRPLRILTDLAGPKLRTGPLAPGPPVVRLRPVRDALGRPAAPARARLVPRDAPRPAEGPDGPVCVPVDVHAGALDRLRPGDELRLRDARGAARTLAVVAAAAGGPVVETMRTTYLTDGVALEAGGVRARVADLPAVPGALTLAVGDALVLTDDDSPLPPPGPGGTARIGCTLPEALGAVRPGHRVFLDDGKFGAVVEEVAPGRAHLRIVSAPPGGARLRAEKGVNLPDTDVPVPALTPKDRRDLGSVVGDTDVVGLSFVREARDVRLLQDHLASLRADHLGVLLKIETIRGFQRLPELVLAAMRSPRVGVMIARGDLAVEAGYERLAEVQEEILWLCEAAHLPVVWATEVLDHLARTGRPSRAEITDAAMSERAECVMLNKGPHIAEAVATLDDILVRMTAHQRKKRPLLRPLRSWADALAPADVRVAADRTVGSR